MRVKKLLVAFFAVVLSVTLVGCSSATSTSSSNSGIKEMKGEELAKIEDDNKEKENYLVIDVRDEKEYKEGHLKNAVNIPVKDIKNSIEKIAKWRDKNVVTYCNTGKKSKEAADILATEGFKNISNAQGVKDYSYNLVKYTNLLGFDMQDAINSEEKAVFLDARDKKDFDEITVMGAKSVDAKNLDNLSSILPENKDTKIYTFCYSGNRSATVAQKLIDLGYTNVYNAIDGTKEYNYKFSESDCCKENHTSNGESSNHNNHDMKSEDKKEEHNYSH